MNRKLTLEYGLRFGVYTPLWTPSLKAASFDPSSYKLGQAPTLFQPALNPQGVRSAFNPVTGNAILPKDQRTITRYFNTSVFQAPNVGTIGNSPKDVFRGPGINNWDLSIFKNFPIRDRARVQFRWEMYNAFNHPSFQGVNTSASFAAPGASSQLNGQFGQITSTNGQPRVMQGSLRVTF